MIEYRDIISIAKNAGEKIIEIYNDPEFASHVDYKSDNSPLTLADQAAHEIIMEALTKTFPDIPIISEEGANVPYSEKRNYKKYWIVDPLDGTKEFINRNGDFTVNIALIQDQYPLCGVVYVPVTQTTYYGEADLAVKVVDGHVTLLKVMDRLENRIAVRSKSHPSPEEEELLKNYKVVDTLSRGSSLKFCALAEGSADIYYRHGPTMEWDTAAGQAVLEAAGGSVYIGDKPIERFKYNKEDLLNPSFLCLGFPATDQ